MVTEQNVARIAVLGAKGVGKTGKKLFYSFIYQYQLDFRFDFYEAWTKQQQGSLFLHYLEIRYEKVEIIEILITLEEFFL